MSRSGQLFLKVCLGGRCVALERHVHFADVLAKSEEDGWKEHSKWKTSETVTGSRLYISECCGKESTFDVGDTFQRCPRCQALCVWELEDEVVFLKQPERENGIAA